jgi:hypothetical protein
MSVLKKLIYGLYYLSSPHRLKQTNIVLKFSRNKKYLHETGLDNHFFYKGISKHTLEYIKINNLSDIHKKDSAHLLELLCEILKMNFDRKLLLCIAELCYKEAEDGHKDATKLYLTTAYYSYSFLFDSNLSDINYFSPNFILARNLYNFSLARLTKRASIKKVDTKIPIELSIINGQLIITSIKNELKWDIENFIQVYAAYEFEIKGFLVESKEYGIGAPIVAIRTKKNSIPHEERFLPPGEQAYASTCFLRFQNILNSETKNNHKIKASIEFYNPETTTHIFINNRKIPLEVDLTARLAYMLKGKPYTRNMRRLLEPGTHINTLHHGINMISPFDSNKIPVILVHGLLSTARTWEQAVNILSKNPTLRKNYQVWFFSYPTGNPILHSARYLRRSLIKIWKQYDPEHKNTKLNNSVIIGHSMGGLLAKLLLITSEGELLKPFTDIPLEKLNLRKRIYNYTKDMVIFKSLPYISRCIYISTPHGGAKGAINPLSRFSSSVIQLSNNLQKNFIRFEAKVLKKSNKKQLANNAFLRTGIDSLDPGNPTLEILENLQKTSNVKYHSIIGNVKKADTPGGSDSIVSYKSSHIDYAVSEKIVKCNHASHKDPAAILEIERILLEHIKDFDEKEVKTN